MLNARDSESYENIENSKMCLSLSKTVTKEN